MRNRAAFGAISWTRTDTGLSVKQLLLSGDVNLVFVPDMKASTLLAFLWRANWIPPGLSTALSNVAG